MEKIQVILSPGNSIQVKFCDERGSVSYRTIELHNRTFRFLHEITVVETGGLDGSIQGKTGILYQHEGF